MAYQMDYYRENTRSGPSQSEPSPLQEDQLPEEAAWGNQAMIEANNLSVAPEVEASESGGGSAEQAEAEQEEEVLGPGGFDYHGEELVNPAVAYQDPAAIPDSIYAAAYQDYLGSCTLESVGGVEWRQMQAEAEAAAALAVSRYEALLQEESSSGPSAEALRHLPPEDREALELIAREQALHRLNVGHTGGVGEVDLASMNPTEQYNYLHDLVLRSGGTFTEADLEVNLIGIRGMNVEGETHDNGLGEDGLAAYDDTIYAVRMVDGKPEVYTFAATTDYGDRSDLQETNFGYDDPDGEREYLLLADGSYDMYMNSNITTMSATDLQAHALREGRSYVEGQNPATSVLDVDRDRQVDPEELENHSYQHQGINVHVGGRYDDAKVDSWSAGCQVIPRAPRDAANGVDGVSYYDTFLRLLQEDPRAAEANKGTNAHVGYTLATAQNLPSAG